MQIKKLQSAILLFLIFTSVQSSAQFWGAKTPRPIDTPKDSLKKGEFTWQPEIAPKGPIVVSVSLDEQLAYTYRNGILIGIATVSSGKPGHGTPTGVFTTTLKDAKHHSSKYNNASMPYTQRITNDGVALHAGGLPGYPSSHGCVHLPSEYARLLFNESPLGMTVVITTKSKFPEEVNHPAFLSPVLTDGKIQDHEKLSSTEKFRWKPELSPEGPLAMLISRVDERLVVIRNGIEIGRCKVGIVNEKDSIGTIIYVAHANDSNTTQPTVGTKHFKWKTFPVTEMHYGSENTIADRDQMARLKIPDAFLMNVRPLVDEGTTLMITDSQILAKTTGVKMAVLSSSPISN